MQAVQIAHIACGIILLRFGKNWATPITRLLLFGNVCAEHFLHQLFQTVAVGVRACQARGDLGAEQWCRDDIQIMRNRGQIESGIVKKLHPCRVGKNGA